MFGEKLFDYDMNVTKAEDTGISLQQILSGTPIPKEGARIDVYFEGIISGRVNGHISGIDYIDIRADGRMSLNIFARVETSDGAHIAVKATGVAISNGDGTAQINENVQMITNAEKYVWVNTHQVWSVGTMNFMTSKLLLSAYLQ